MSTVLINKLKFDIDIIQYDYTIFSFKRFRHLAQVTMLNKEKKKKKK